ncbi:hypothetical protein N326_01653, partial [Eurypyga helias]
FFQLSPCYGSSQELKKKKLQYLLQMVQISDCSHYSPQQQHLAGTFQDAAEDEVDLRRDQDLNSF